MATTMMIRDEKVTYVCSSLARDPLGRRSQCFRSRSRSVMTSRSRSRSPWQAKTLAIRHAAKTAANMCRCADSALSEASQASWSESTAALMAADAAQTALTLGRLINEAASLAAPAADEWGAAASATTIAVAATAEAQAALTAATTATGAAVAATREALRACNAACLRVHEAGTVPGVTGDDNC